MDVTEALRPWLVACWPPGAEKDALDDGGLLKGRLEQARKFESLCASLPGDADRAQSSLGRLAVTKDAIIWDGMAHDEAHVQALVPGEHIDDLELSMDDRGHPFVLLILQIPHEDPVDLLLRATDGSSLEAHEVLEDLYNLVETVRASALDAMDDMPSARREAGSPGEESKRDRRASISLDAVTSLIAESEDHEQDETQDDNEASVLAEASPAPPRNGATERTIASAETHIEMSAETESPSTPNKLEKSSSGDDLRARVRAFVRDPQGQQESLLEMLNSKYAYDLSCVPTPSRERVARSPARNTEPQKKYLRKLKPIVVDMQENSKKERADIERATNVKIKSPHGRSRKMQYIDQESLQVLSPADISNVSVSNKIKIEIKVKVKVKVKQT
ncbi:Hypothetical Protein FCC1311_053962 [Hondaea fermentalgiana]|uniref:Uncharacterized protein n=1 Tax=Hondaea fermentalgiana TaxID=2315210 RepID=A0A2R5GMT2_9STRA|nr:Hypothetical Protein FCC1311_053962 [Hondaea fermentalgiana]|eukprot:GBG29174.1 Hypothetical Protein FCC1311_053962 [Hondaea fermentalgiana]